MTFAHVLIAAGAASWIVTLVWVMWTMPGDRFAWFRALLAALQCLSMGLFLPLWGFVAFLVVSIVLGTIRCLGKEWPVAIRIAWTATGVPWGFWMLYLVAAAVGRWLRAWIQKKIQNLRSPTRSS